MTGWGAGNGRKRAVDERMERVRGKGLELLGKSRDELKAYCAELGEAAYRADQIYHWLYAEREFSVERWSNLPAALREKLKLETTITLPSVRQRYVSSDGSVRYLFGLGGREDFTTEDTESTENKSQGSVLKKPAAVEAVFMPSEGRQTICISTQAGCAVDCQFCLTAQGEPLLNFESVMGALRILLDAEGVGLSPKHVTLSTSGIVPGIERLGKEEVRPKLAISLNASCDEQRNALMPINKKYPLKALMEACRNYPLRNWEHLTFEYVMLGGVNDAAEDARRVVRLLAPLTRVKVNLIPWNPGELPYKESNAETIEEFRRILVEKGVPAFVRYSRGRDVMAACGQLALKEVQGAALTVLG